MGLSGPKVIPRERGTRCVIIERDDLTRYSWVYYYCIVRNSNVIIVFRKLLAEMPANVLREIVKFDGGGKNFEGQLGKVFFLDLRVVPEVTTAKRHQVDVVPELMP